MPEVTIAPEPAIEQAKALVAQVSVKPTVTNAIELAEANTYLRDVKDRYRQVEALRTSITKPLDAAKASVQALFKPVLAELTELEADVKQAVIRYQQLENQRILEQRRQQQEAIRAAEQAAADEAAFLELSGEGEKATEVLLQASLEAGASVKVDDAPVAEGFSVRTTYRAEVVDFAALIAHCAKTGDYTLVEPNQKALDARARAWKREGPLVPGVEVHAEQHGVVR